VRRLILLLLQPTLRPLAPAPLVELAPYMADLARLTRKLALAIDAGNLPLARFYAYETEAQLRRTQREVPEYERQPIALLIDRHAYFTPPVQTLMNFARTEAVLQKAIQMGGYDLAGCGTVRWLSP